MKFFVVSLALLVSAPSLADARRARPSGSCGAQSLGFLDDVIDKGKVIAGKGEEAFNNVKDSLTDIVSGGVEQLTATEWLDSMQDTIQAAVDEQVTASIEEFVVTLNDAQEAILEGYVEVQDNTEEALGDLSVAIDDASKFILNVPDAFGFPDECVEGVKDVYDAVEEFAIQCIEVLPSIPDLVVFDGTNDDLRDVCTTVREAVQCYDARADIDDAMIIAFTNCARELDFFNVPSVDCMQEYISLRDSSELFLQRSLHLDVLCMENEIKGDGELCIESMYTFAQDHTENYARCSKEFLGLAGDCSDECREMAQLFQQDVGCCLTGAAFATGVVDNLGDNFDLVEKSSACGTEMFSCDNLDTVFSNMNDITLPPTTTNGLPLAAAGTDNDGDNGSVAGTAESGMSAGAAAGTAIGVILAVVAASAAGFYVYRRKNPKQPVVVISEPPRAIGSPSLVSSQTHSVPEPSASRSANTTSGGPSGGQSIPTPVNPRYSPYTVPTQGGTEMSRSGVSAASATSAFSLRSAGANAAAAGPRNPLGARTLPPPGRPGAGGPPSLPRSVPPRSSPAPRPAHEAAFNNNAVQHTAEMQQVPRVPARPGRGGDSVPRSARRPSPPHAAMNRTMVLPRNGAGRGVSAGAARSEAMSRTMAMRPTGGVRPNNNNNGGAGYV